MKDEEKENYKRFVTQRLAYLMDIFEEIAIGDF